MTERATNYLNGMPRNHAQGKWKGEYDLNTSSKQSTFYDAYQLGKTKPDPIETVSTEKLEGGYGWAIVFASFMAHVTIYGLSWSVGVFNIIFLEEFQGSKTSTAWVGSMLNAVLYCTGVVSSALTQRYGCRMVLICGGVLASSGIALSALAHRLYVLYITFSVLGGAGLGLAYIPSVVIVSQYFERRRTIALGLAVSGAGFGSFIFPPLIRALMEVYTWRTVMLVIAGIILGTLTLTGAVMKPAPEADESCKESYFAEFKSNLRIMKSVPFLTLCFNNFFYCFGLVIVYVHLGAFAKSSGLFSKSNSPMIFSIIGVANLVGRVLHGVVCHSPKMTTILVYMVSSLASGVATVLIPSSASQTTLAIAACVFGFSSSCLGALTPDIIIRVVGEKRLGSGYGMILLFESAGSILGGPIAGMLYDYTLVYDYSFYLAGALLIGASLVMVVPWQYTRSCQECLLERQDSLAAGTAGPSDSIRKTPADPRDFLALDNTELDTEPYSIQVEVPEELRQHSDTAGNSVRVPETASLTRQTQRSPVPGHILTETDRSSVRQTGTGAEHNLALSSPLPFTKANRGSRGAVVYRECVCHGDQTPSR